MRLLQPAVRARVAELRREFAQAQPFHHVIVDGFFDPDFSRALSSEFPGFDGEQARNEVGEIGRKAVHSNLAELGPAYAKLDALLQDPGFLDFISEITGIPNLLYDPDYVGGGTHENLDGQDLDVHVDFNYHPKTRLHRRLNLIVFLNPEWDPAWGGCLELQKDPSLRPADNMVRTVTPLANRCVIFETTENSWHGFRRIALPPDKAALSRRSIAVYFYTKERPPQETAPSHGTIYVQRPMPEHLQAGHRLTEEDVAELALQFARRDAHIQYLYEREKEFTRIAGSPAFRIARGITWPLRKMRSLLR